LNQARIYKGETTQMSAPALDIIQTFSKKFQKFLENQDDNASILDVKQYLSDTVSEYDFGKLQPEVDEIGTLLSENLYNLLADIDSVNWENIYAGFRNLCKLEGRLMYSNTSEPQGVQK
jgi:hypothetical protein